MTETTKSLTNNCPKCKAKLYAFYHEASSGDECTGTWNVECTKCDYTPPNNCFASVDSLGKEFKIA